MIRRTNARSVAARVPLPHPRRWLLTAAALLAVAGYVGVLDGLGGLRAWIGGWVPPGGEPVLGSATPGVLVAVLTLIAGLFALRRGLFALLARRPGPIEVTAFHGLADDGYAPDPTADTAQVAAEFRRTLTEMSLSTPLSMPTSPRQDEFIDDVGTVADSTTTFGAAVALVRAALRIQYAYRVAAQMRVRRGEERFGITVHLVMQPGGRGEVATLWAADWASAADLAAHWVGAQILPRSRLARRAPWTSWHGLQMPPALFHHSQLARRCVAERRFEEALGHFHEALVLDPQNPYLRIERAQVLEQLGLSMDAVVAYADIVAVESWHDRTLWRRLRAHVAGDADPSEDDVTWASTRADGPPPPRLRALVTGQQALLIARYRLVTRLASQTVAQQWWRVDDYPDARNTKRTAERRELRARLRTWLEPYYPDYLADLQGSAENVPFDVAVRRQRLLAHLLCFVSWVETEHLLADYRWWQLRRRPGMAVSQTALRVLRVWAPLLERRAAVKVEGPVWDELQAKRRPDRRPDGRTITRPKRWPDVVWPPDITVVEADLERVLRRKPARWREWQEYYNAACAAAVALGGRRDDAPDELRPWARLAVRYLERAVSSTDSGFVGAYTQWLSTGDDDLRSLRSLPEFVDFLDRYLPTDDLRAPPPHRLVELVMSQHAVRLLRTYATDRVAALDQREEAELPWEARARAVATEFTDQDRDWRCRLRLVRSGQKLRLRMGGAPFPSALPEFDDDPAAWRYNLAGAGQGNGEVAKRHYRGYITFRRGALAEAYAILAGVPAEPLTVAGSRAMWQRIVAVMDRALDGPPSTP
ncbi:hypothetical protein ACQEVB_22275 [Pseudonocardia sp. CA-107938]|uniref:hypothetical protein n=1 Tax=Pseudonocardia sp. CA-107938 TaxID=3240021 RepID=UPI003D90AFAE